MADKLDMKSMDITQGNIEKIRALFPSAVWLQAAINEKSVR